jgi:hypothetical protein
MLVYACWCGVVGDDLVVYMLVYAGVVLLVMDLVVWCSMLVCGVVGNGPGGMVYAGGWCCW